MKPCHIRAVTLIELLIATALVGFMVLAFSSLDTFGRFHVISSDKRAQTQNDVAYVLQHLESKLIKALAVGTAASNLLSVQIDSDSDGRKTASDRWLVYNRSSNSLNFYSDCASGIVAGCAGSPEVLSSRITGFTANFNTGDNFLTIDIVGRYAPSAALSVDNPEVTLRNSIYLPSVSTH